MLITIVILLGFGHCPHGVWGPSHGLSLVLDQDLVHPHLLRLEDSLPARGSHLEVHEERTGGTDDLCRDGVLVEALRVQDVQLEVALLKQKKGNSKY